MSKFAPAFAAALLLLAGGCNRVSDNSDLEDRIDKLETENTELRAKVADYEAKDAARAEAEAQAAARKTAAAAAAASAATPRGPENASTAADNAAAAAQEALDAAKM